MAVYILRLGEHGPVVKIGTAKNVAKRVAALQTSNHERLILLRQFEGGRPEEHRLHKLFADHRVSREFFTFSKAMLGDVGLVEIGVAPVEETPPPAAPIETEDESARVKRAFEDGIAFGMKAATLMFRAALSDMTREEIAEAIKGLKRDRLSP